MEIIFKYAVVTLATGFGLYLVWKLVKVIHRYNVRRRREVPFDPANESICVHTADGNIIRVKRPPRDGDADASAPFEIPDFLLAKPSGKNSADKK